MLDTFCLGTSNPYCVIGLIKKEHQDMVSSSEHNLVDLYRLKGLELECEQSEAIDNTVNPSWNKDFEMYVRYAYMHDVNSCLFVVRK